MATFVPRVGPSGQRTWQVKVRRKGWPPLSATFDTKADASAWARQIEGEMDRGTFVSRSEAWEVSLGEALERYATEVSTKKRSGPREAYTRRYWQGSPLAHRSLASLRGKDITLAIRQLEAEGLGSNTIRLHLALLSHLFTVARMDWGFESLANPVASVRKPKVAPGRTRRLEEDEERRLMDAARIYGGEIGGIIQWALETAMRRGEICRMEWEHIDGSARVLQIPVTKNGLARRIPLSSKALAVLAQVGQKGRGPVWSLRPDSITQAFERICDMADISGLTFHDLRHEATSRLFEKGLNPMEVAAITGHQSLQMLKRYTHLRPEDLVERLG